MPEKGEQCSDWKDASTLEEWVKRALSEGRDEEVVKAIKALPEASREKYRVIWRAVKGRKGA